MMVSSQLIHSNLPNALKQKGSYLISKVGTSINDSGAENDRLESLSHIRATLLLRPAASACARACEM